MSAAGSGSIPPSEAREAAARPTRAVIKNVDMPEDMQQRAVDTASAALEEYNVERDIAMHIKKEFDRVYGTTWHCIVGKNFGSFVTHETRNFIYFYLNQIAILLWKTS